MFNQNELEFSQIRIMSTAIGNYMVISNTCFFYLVSAKALPAYSKKRTVDAQAICDLAMYNYIEVSSSV